MRLVFCLFEQTPLAFANFHALCTHSISGLGQAGQMLTYRRSKIHKVIKGGFLVGGDITLGDGRGGDSIYGAAGFEDEPFGLKLRHDSAGLLSMASRTPDCNQSQFRVTFGAAPQLDGRHVIIGRLVSGQSHLAALEALPVDADGSPARPITVVECGCIPGWARLPPPLPQEADTARATVASVGEKSSSLRSGIDEAVQAALAQGTKRGADEGGPSSSAAAPAAKRQGGMSAMMDLPFAAEMDGEDSDDDYGADAA